MGRGVAAIEPGSVVAVISLLQDILEIFILDAPFRTCGSFLVFQDVCIVHFLKDSCEHLPGPLGTVLDVDGRGMAHHQGVPYQFQVVRDLHPEIVNFRTVLLHDAVVEHRGHGKLHHHLGVLRTHQFAPGVAILFPQQGALRVLVVDAHVSDT